MQRRGLSLIDQELSKLRGSELFEIFGDVCTTPCPWHFGMKPLSGGSETSHSDRIYIAGVQRRDFSLVDQILSKIRGLDLDDFEIFGDVCSTLCPPHFGVKPLS